jgi:D-glycero-beta-D-manno-heptose-7-phosphate kinase
VSVAIENLFEKFRHLRVMVIGDVMIDSYLWGDVERISPEAPVPVVNVTRKEHRLGGAANVALNIAAMGAQAVVCSVIGDDNNGHELSRLTEFYDLGNAGLIHSSSRITTVKTRVISHHQQMLRIDEEQTTDLTKEEQHLLYDRVRSIIAAEKIDVIIFEDYNKGILMPELIDKIVAFANDKNIPTCVDPKKKNFLAYKNVTLFKPNLKELKEGLKMDFDRNDDEAIKRAAVELEKILNNKISLITLSERGVYIKSNKTDAVFPAHIRNISDVSGAGDTVIAVAALCLASDVPHDFLARLANLAGGLVCEKVGVVPVDKDQLLVEAKEELTNA